MGPIQRDYSRDSARGGQRQTYLTVIDDGSPLGVGSAAVQAPHDNLPNARSAFRLLRIESQGQMRAQQLTTTFSYEPERRDRYADLGYVDVLRKPIETNRLIDLIQRAVGLEG